MRDTVHVACAGNSGYMMPMTVMLASLVDNFDAERDLHLHIISNDATEQQREDLLTSIAMNRPGMKRIKIDWYSVDSSELEKLHLPSGCRLSRDTFARLFIPSILPESCERVIYLDCDMIVLADVSRLFDSTVGDSSPVHAVHDMSTPWVSTRPGGVFDYVERGIPADTRYFNAGMLVINLSHWRKYNLSPAMLDYYAFNWDRIFFHDQGTLNAFFAKEWTPVDPCWNQSPIILFEKLWIAAGYSHEEWVHIKNHPCIVHYFGPGKPWLPGRRAPRACYFFRYLRKTVYKDRVPHTLHLEDIVGFRVYYQIWKWTRKIVPGLPDRTPTPPPRPSSKVSI